MHKIWGPMGYCKLITCHLPCCYGTLIAAMSCHQILFFTPGWWLTKIIVVKRSSFLLGTLLRSSLNAQTHIPSLIFFLGFPLFNHLNSMNHWKSPVHWVKPWFGQWMLSFTPNRSLSEVMQIEGRRQCEAANCRVKRAQSSHWMSKAGELALPLIGLAPFCFHLGYRGAVWQQISASAKYGANQGKGEGVCGANLSDQVTPAPLFGRQTFCDWRRLLLPLVPRGAVSQYRASGETERSIELLLEEKERSLAGVSLCDPLPPHLWS